MRSIFNRWYEATHNRKHRRKKADDDVDVFTPTLASIPEAAVHSSSLSHSNGIRSRMFQSAQSFVLPHKFESAQRIRHHQRHQQLSTKQQYRRRQHFCEVCFLILAPGYIILTVFTFMHPSLRSIREVNYISPEKYRRRVGDSKQLLRTGVLLRESTITNMDGSRNDGSLTMSTKRIVLLASDEDVATSMTSSSIQIEDVKYNAQHTWVSPIPDEGSFEQNNDSECVPMAKWQTMSFPTCNSMHEIGLFATSPTLSYFNFHEGTDGEQRVSIPNAQNVNLLGNGWFRDAWNVVDLNHDASLAVKTLRLEREYLPEYYELHRRDAVAMERLSPSSFVLDVYGYCGQSAMTELAFLEKGINNLYRLSTGLKDIFTPYVLRTKLQIAAMTSLGLAHVHGVPLSGDAKKHDNTATLVHYDINPRNIIMTASGKPKINDFNQAQFMTVDSNNQPCGFESRLHEPWWRAPEEMVMYNDTDGSALILNPTMIDEKVDVYSLGNTLYVLLTGLEPRGKENKKQRYKSVSNMVAKGELPSFPKQYAESSDPAITAIMKAILLCWESDPSGRPSAMDISKLLYKALEGLNQYPQYECD